MLKASLGRKKAFIDTPELSDLIAMLLFLQHAITRQARTRGPLAGAHGVALAGNRQAGAAGNPDITGNQIQIINAANTVGAMSTLVNTHRPNAHRRRRLGVNTCDVFNHVGIYAANARGSNRVILGNSGF